MNTDLPEPKPRRKSHLYKWLILLTVAIFAYGAWRAYAFRSALKEAEALRWSVSYTDPSTEIQQNWKTALKKETWLDGVTWMLVPSGEELEEHRAMIQELNPKRLTIWSSQTLRDLSSLKGHTRLKYLSIGSASNLTNLDTLPNLTALEQIEISDAAALTNVDGLKNLLAVKNLILADAKKLANVDALTNVSTLQYVALDNCIGLTNVDGLKDHKELQWVGLRGCTALTNVDGLRNLPALKKVEFLRCTKLTKESLDALRATLPNTDVLTD